MLAGQLLLRSTDFALHCIALLCKLGQFKAPHYRPSSERAHIPKFCFSARFVSPLARHAREVKSLARRINSVVSLLMCARNFKRLLNNQCERVLEKVSGVYVSVCELKLDKHNRILFRIFRPFPFDSKLTAPDQSANGWRWLSSS